MPGLPSVGNAQMWTPSTPGPLEEPRSIAQPATSNGSVTVVFEAGVSSDIRGALVATGDVLGVLGVVVVEDVVNVRSPDVAIPPAALRDSTRKWYVVPADNPDSVWLCAV